ncbi:MAG: creatininase family protein [Vicinamibacteria bacterium]|nr:creatininase family protein [Vicinamibacteria bacterium]
MKYLAEMTFVEVQDMGPEALVIVPIGAIEAHGPHLPLHSDVIIARAMAAAGAMALEARGVSPVVIAPALQFTSAGFAEGFAGTLSLRPETVTAVLVDVLASLHRAGFARILLANSHLDPSHIASLHEAVRVAREISGLAVTFPDITKKPWALRLSEEFKSGACHAGQFETSMVMAARPETVRESIRVSLASNPASLSQAIREGKKTFEEAGGPTAYFGFPKDASADEGRETLGILASILADAVIAVQSGGEAS